MVELDRPKFRHGEARNRPIGGNVADTPFTLAFRNVMLEAGFDSQLSLSRALNKNSNRDVSNWLTGKKFPSPQEVGGFLVVVEANGVESDNESLDVFLNEYGNRLRERESLGIGATNALKVARASRRTFDNPVSKYIEIFCDERNISLSGFFEEIGYQVGEVTSRANLSYPALVEIEKGVTSRYGKDAGDLFGRAIDEEIKKRKKEGRRVKTSSFRGMTRKQNDSRERLYNGSQAAKMLGSTRASISKYRIKLGWGFLLTGSQVEQLGKIMEKNRNIKGHKAEEREIFFRQAQIFPLVS
ncbi:MAG: hypothetical protein A3B41_00545 [Candidatus Levybacteria bacterium RIFCSPLOWO2_01_FULL_37_26]|nr:MAG: hypothetical protein A3E40_00805 [Candidatus Levybacteria bacterium RIFCSPHIGHO2_12_FULL_37_9]OGH39490.1 MAG: hypothetical protein A3B41_00545 [Candidatus Levybacteria bacterium RIFCSPLOWO2_01_FULL_37_26]